MGNLQAILDNNIRNGQTKESFGEWNGRKRAESVKIKMS